MISKLQAFEPETLRVKGPFTPRDGSYRRCSAPGNVTRPGCATPRVNRVLSFTTARGLDLVPEIGALLLEQPNDLSANKPAPTAGWSASSSSSAEYRFRVDQRGRVEVVGPRA